MLGKGESRSSLVASQNLTPDTHHSHGTEREYKRPKNNRTSGSVAVAKGAFLAYIDVF